MYLSGQLKRQKQRPQAYPLFRRELPCSLHSGRQAESKTKDICPIYKGKCILTPTDLQEDEALHQKAVS